MKTEWSRRELEAHGEPICPQLPTKWDRRCGGGGKGNTPPPPDYEGAAKAQSKSSKEVTNMQTWANRPSQQTPWGSVDWKTEAVVDPATGQKVTQWTQQYNLTPEAQKALDSQMAVQQGRSDLAQSFMGRVADEYAKPFDWGSMPERGQNVNTSNFQQLSGESPRLQGYVGNSPQLQTYNANTPDLQRYSGDSPQMRSDIATENAQRVGGGPRLDSRMRAMATQNRMDFNDNGQLQGTDDAARQRIEAGLFERMAPMHERQQSALEVKLANQGITPGSVAYKRAMQGLGDQQSREKYDALQTAGQEIQRNQQMALGNRQQLTNEDVAGANLFNTANQQAFNQTLASKQFGNDARQQMYANQLRGAEINNAAIQQDYNQRLGSTGFYNQAGQSQQALDLARMGFNNQADANKQALDLARLGFNNQSMKDQQGLDLARLGFNNQTATGQQALDIQRAGFNNQIGQQQFDQAMRQSQYQNQLRSAAIAEEAQRRGMSLNEMNALLTGQQVGMQQMPQFNAANASQATNYLDAAKLQNDYNWDKYNAQAQQSNSMMSGIGSLAGAAMMFSDKRLKKILGKVGEKAGFNLYRFKYLGSDVEHVGVIAQEVQKVRPDLVKRHANGFLMVNYAGLEV